MGLPNLYSQPHGQIENLAGPQPCLVEAVDRCGMMIIRDGQVESVSGAQPGCELAEILFG
jgi:hypothetical protein